MITKKRKYMGYAEDRLITPYIIYTHLPTNTKYVDFPLIRDNEYQKCRFYSDERPLKLSIFEEMCKGIKRKE